MRQLQIGLLVLMVFGGGFLFGNQFSVSQAQTGYDIPDELETALIPLVEAYNLIDTQYIEEIETGTLIDGAISGMVESLEDPYSTYVNAELAPFVDDRLSGEIEGIGATITLIQETGEIEIVNLLPGTPAEASGLRPGDVFVSVNGEEVFGLNSTEVAALVRGPVGTTVDLVMRRGVELIEFTVERARIELINVEYELLEDNIGYIRLANFSVDARDLIDDALVELNAADLNGLILDLRNNPGGYLTVSTEIAGLFIEEGPILIEEFGTGEQRTFRVQDGIVYQTFQDGSERPFAANAGYAGVDAPIVVLINEASASASELVAGAWQASEVATIIGTTSFGKGTVQTLSTLPNGGSLRLTIARWLTPDGISITELGITPDIVVEMPEPEEPELDTETVEPGTPDAEELPDPQLDAAIEFILGESVDLD
jgi:carboxyl-terminal processing protease